MALDDADIEIRIDPEDHPADIAAALLEIDPREGWRLLCGLPVDVQAEVFGYLEPELQEETIEHMTRPQLTALITEMKADDRADVFNRLSEDQQEMLLPALAHVERENIRKLASYEEGSAGAIMTSDYATLKPELTAKEAIAQLRREAPDKETIYRTYVLQDDRELIGTVRLTDLILAPPSRKVSDLMDDDPVYVNVDDDQESVARTVAKYDILAVPVVDAQHHLLGIVTHDDAMDALEEEATEDFRRLGAHGDIDESVRTAGIFTLYRARIVWLILLVFGNLLSGFGIAYFENIIAAHIALIFFLPLLIASGGNAGAQASTLMVRALATGDVRSRDWGRMLGREFLVAAALGLTMALAVSGIGIFRGGTDIAMIVAMSMIIIVLVGSLIGMSLPFVLSRFNMDPATASAPLVTSIADATGVVIYFSIASMVLFT
jgi:magnesium transporter